MKINAINQLHINRKVTETVTHIQKNMIASPFRNENGKPFNLAIPVQIVQISFLMFF